MFASVSRLWMWSSETVLTSLSTFAPFTLAELCFFFTPSLTIQTHARSRYTMFDTPTKMKKKPSQWFANYVARYFACARIYPLFVAEKYYLFIVDFTPHIYHIWSYYYYFDLFRVHHSHTHITQARTTHTHQFRISVGLSKTKVA